MYGTGTESSPITLDSDFEYDGDTWPVFHAVPMKSYDRTIRQPELLLGLPMELLRMVTDASNLSNVDRHSLKMTTHGLRNAGFETTTMSKSEYLLFNKQLEAGLPDRHHRLAQDLLCSHCLSFLPKSAFPDAHSKPSCTAPRSCLQCSIKNGHFNRRRFQLNRKEHFVCAGCKAEKPVPMLEDLGKDKVMKLWQRFGAFRWVELRVRMAKRRWCKDCWKAIDGFWDFAGEPGKMKEKFGPHESAEE